MGTQMLKGIKVLDFTINAAGPIVGCYFADLGAEVVKVEAAGGEPGRRFAQYVNGVSTYNVGKDRGKKSIEMNLKDPRASAQWRRRRRWWSGTHEAPTCDEFLAWCSRRWHASPQEWRHSWRGR